MCEVATVCRVSRANRTVVEDGAGGRRWDEEGSSGEKGQTG